MAHAFLFVDDSALHHQMYRLIFSRGALAGNTLYHATNGREGYALLDPASRAGPGVPRPQHAGDERPRGAGPPRGRAAASPGAIVLVTTESTEDDEAQARSAGAWDYLRKPFQPADVERLVARALAEAAGSAA